MRKAVLSLTLGLLLLACSIPAIALPQPAPTATAASPTASLPVTPSSTPSITPTLPTPTFSATPTPLSASTYTPLPPGTRGTSSPTPQAFGFTSVLISGSQILWGACEPSQVKITAHVADPAKVSNVVLFIRLKARASGEMTPWDSGRAMDERGNGTFTVTLKAKSIADYSSFARAWVLYQLVATDRDANIIGRTQVYSGSLTLAPCP